jgi:hypothetical protein
MEAKFLQEGEVGEMQKRKWGEIYEGEDKMGKHLSVFRVATKGFPCNFPPFRLFSYERGLFRNMENDKYRDRGEGGGEVQRVSSLEIIVHYMHEHELLKGQKKRGKKCFPRRLHLLAISERAVLDGVSEIPSDQTAQH